MPTGADDSAPDPRTVRPTLSVVVPVHDEVENVEAVCRELAGALDGIDAFEVLFVDDGSTDGTADRLLALRAAGCGIASLRVLRLDRRCGKSEALHRGIEAARADWIATIDGDRQDDPTELAPMLRLAIERGPPFPVVIGVRTARRDTAAKRVATRLANGLRARILGDDCPDTSSPTKVFRRDAFLRLPRFDGQHRFLPALFQYDGGTVLQRPVGHRPRVAGRSKYSNLQRALVGVWDLAGVIWLRARTTPARSVREL